MVGVCSLGRKEVVGDGVWLYGVIWVRVGIARGTLRSGWVFGVVD